MRIGNALTSLLAATMVFSGCREDEDSKISKGPVYAEVSISQLKNDSQYEGRMVRVSGLPLGVSEGTGYHSKTESSIGVVIRDGEEFLLGSNAGTYRSAVVEGGALIESEIGDGDNEPISLKGTYRNGRLALESLSANGYEVNFK